jgi:hypothetical protein
MRGVWRQGILLGCVGVLAVLSSRFRSEAEEPAPLDLRLGDYTVLPFQVEPSAEYYELGETPTPYLPRLQRFFEDYSTQWEVRWDLRSDRPNVIQGVGIPMLPGKGNSLTYQDIGEESAESLKLEDVEQLVRSFMSQYPEIFDFPQVDLVLAPERSGNYGEAKQLWYVDFQQVHQGLEVVEASLVFRINNGNIVQFGAERLAEVSVNPVPALSVEDAFAQVLEFTWLEPSQLAAVDFAGTKLEIHPMMAADEMPGERYTKTTGAGYLHALAWRIRFSRLNDLRNFEAIVDAHSGEILQFRDTNSYLDRTVQGGVYLESPINPEVVVPFPYAKVVINDAITRVTDASGIS